MNLNTFFHCYNIKPLHVNIIWNCHFNWSSLLYDLHFYHIPTQ